MYIVKYSSKKKDCAPKDLELFQPTTFTKVPQATIDSILKTFGDNFSTFDSNGNATATIDTPFVVYTVEVKKEK